MSARVVRQDLTGNLDYLALLRIWTPVILKVLYAAFPEGRILPRGAVLQSVDKSPVLSLQRPEGICRIGQTFGMGSELYVLGTLIQQGWLLEVNALLKLPNVTLRNADKAIWSFAHARR